MPQLGPLPWIGSVVMMSLVVVGMVYMYFCFGEVFNYDINISGKTMVWLW